MPNKQEPVNLPCYNSPKVRGLPARRRLLAFFVATFTLVSFGLRVIQFEKTAIRVTNAVQIAHDPRLEAYQSIDDAQECAEWPTSTDSDLSTVSFNLLKGADLLFVLSRGPVTGHFDMDRRTNYSYPGASPYITVEVTTQYQDESDLRTKVCLMGNETRNERGILIWGEPGHALTSINVTIIIPLHLRSHKDITTDLPMFSHDITGSFDDWWSPTYFGDLRFKSSNAPILYSKGLNGKSVFVQTSNGPVVGQFWGDHLHVQTSNAPIQVEAFLGGLGDGSEINLTNSNGTIEAAFGVSSGTVNTILKALVHTSHAAVRILADPFESMYTNSSLTLDVVTSEAPVAVYLGPSYEGTYDLQTTEAHAEVDADQAVVDPSEMGRERTLHETVSELHDRMWGHMYWSYNGDPSEGVDRGSVSIRSTKSVITMYC